MDAATKILLPHGSFTPGIEGPACDGEGNLYAVNFGRQGTIGVVTPQGQGYVFVELPPGSIGNGIRFDSQGRMCIADFTGHNVLNVDMRTRQVSVRGHDPALHQPNDLCITAADVVYASDPHWPTESGRIWRFRGLEPPVIVSGPMGTTNGIEIHPDESQLFVDESVQRRIWRFDLLADGGLGPARLFHEFPDHGLDGMRFDVEGNLYVTRYGKGTVAVLDPGGSVVDEIPLHGGRPSNLCFGGEDGRTLSITEVDHGTVECIRVPHAGREWKLWQRSAQGPAKGGWDA
jgi:sugar lactone lactonase YvrE